MEDVGEREEKGLRANIEGIVFETEFIPILFHLLDGRDLCRFGEGTKCAL